MALCAPRLGWLIVENLRFHARHAIFACRPPRIARCHDADRAPRQCVAGVDFCVAHARTFSGAAGVCARSRTLARWRRPGACRPGDGHLRADPGPAANPLRYRVGLVGPQARDDHRPVDLCARQLHRRMGTRLELADRRPLASRGRCDLCGGHGHACRLNPRPGPHQGDGAGRRQHCPDVCAVAGAGPAAGRSRRAARHFCADWRTGARRHRGGSVVGARCARADCTGSARQADRQRLERGAAQPGAAAA